MTVGKANSRNTLCLMPTTLTLDDDLSRLLRSAAEQKGKSVSDIALQLLRAALGKAPPPQPAKEPFRIRPHHGVFAPGVPLAKLNRLADEIDTAEFLGRQTS